jgi:DnaJ like chaperone protein
MLKWLGLLLGLGVGNFFGIVELIISAVSGYMIGVYLEQQSDPKYKHRKLLLNNPEALKHLLHQTTFTVMGFLAKADGRVSPREIQAAENIFAHFNLSPSAREDAIRLFNSGKSEGFQLAVFIAPLSSVVSSSRGRKYQGLFRVFLEIQAQMVLADGRPEQATQNAFYVIAKQLGFSKKVAVKILRQVWIKNQAHNQTCSALSESMSLESAYALLEVEPACSDKQLKQAYRKAMSLHHPDKLMSEGATEEMIQTATEQTQAIQQAHQLIIKSRQ